jgi:CheY-like chemotaxis protein
MESVGRLAGGVAHDFNNMIGVILGYVELALMRAEPSAPVRGNLEQIQKAAQRSADLTRQLLAFARKQTATPQVVSLNDVVGGMLGMLRRLIGEDIRLHWSPAADLGPVHVDPGQVEQVLANLCVNARDAIGGAGELVIATGNAEVSEARARRSEALPGSYVSLSVRDDGCGMDREVREHLFEPFFTTKGTGRGTGLGLATVYGIVKQNQGFIEVDSAPGRGSTFTIFLPRHAGTGAAPGEDAAGVAGLARGMETVLLVEDEPDMLSLGRVMLSELGYRVLGAGSPERALALAERHAGELDLLVTDVVMPGMDGQELARRLRERIPGLPVLFISGYPDDVIARRGILSGEVRLLQKPFDLERLAGAVRGALDARRAGMPGAAAEGGGGR